MAQSLSTVYLHVVFSTKDRLPYIDSIVEQRLYSYLASLTESMGCNSLAIGGMEDHVHMLVTLSRAVTVSKLLETVKANSSRWIKSVGDKYIDFAWQKGFGAFSADCKSLGKLKAYIANQKEHHAVRGFKEEYLAILKRYDVPYDERYLWN